MKKVKFHKSKLARSALILIVCLALVLSGFSFGFASISDNPNVEIVSVNDVPGIIIGNYTDSKNATGTTAIICTDPNGATGGVSVLGGSPATRETDLIDPTKTVQIINAVCLSGGSAFGLDAAGGVQNYLEKKGIGVPVGVTVVPIVPAACIFDLHVGPDAALGADMVRPGAPEGYAAADAAFKGIAWKDGNVGGGTGAGAGGMKGGLGSFCYKYGDLFVGVVVVVNAAGQVVDPETGEIIAGRVDTATNTFIDNEERIINSTDVPKADTLKNTTISCVITNAKLTQAEANKLAEMAHDGYSRAIEPTHTPSDGDCVFVMATGGASTSATTWGQESSNMSLLGVLAVNAMERAIVSAAYNAESAYDRLGAATLRAEGKTPAQPAGKSTSALNDVKASPSLRFAESGSAPEATPAQATGISVTIDGNAVSFTADSGQPFVDSNNRTQVPFRQTLEAMGAEVSWDAATKTAKAVYNDITVEVPVGQSYIIKDGAEIANDTSAVNKDGRVYLPIRIVLESFGYSVEWDAASKTVIAVPK